MISTKIAGGVIGAIVAGSVVYPIVDRTPCSELIARTPAAIVEPGDAFRAIYVIDREQTGCHVLVRQHIFYGDSESPGVLYFADLNIPSPGPLGPDIWPVDLPLPAVPVATKARYRATVMYYKNWLQWAINWPVAVNPPDIQFTIQPTKGTDNNG